MRVTQLSWSENAGWLSAPADHSNADLVFFFGTRPALACGERYRELRGMFPDARILGCSTGGQIRNEDIIDDEIAAAAIRFNATQLRVTCEPAATPEGSRACGAAIGKALAAPDLTGVFVLSDGLNVNGSELVAGIIGAVGERVAVTGGLAGDGADFQETLVGADCAPRKHLVAAVGFYGPAVRIGHGSAGGWDEFGPRRRMTRSRGNVLFECDGEPALNPMSAIWVRKKPRACPARACCSRCASSIPNARIMTSCARFSPSIATRADDVCRRRAGRLDGAVDARQLRPAGSRCRPSRATSRRSRRRKARRRSGRHPRELHRSSPADGSAYRR